MKFKILCLSLALAGLPWFTLTAGAQLTVNTVPTTGLDEPSGLAQDAQGNYYLADSANNCIVRIDGSTLAESVLAGTGAPGAANGPGISATFNNPQGLLLVGTNELLVADYYNNMIRAVRLSDGTVSTVAGQTNAGPATDATGTNATFHYPQCLTQDANGNIYIADWGNSAIRVMNTNDPAWGVTNVTLSGATLFRPAAVALAGNQLWVADAGSESTSDNTIRLFTLTSPANGSLTAVIGGNSIHTGPGFNNSLVGTNALFSKPLGLLWVPGSGLLICDTGNHCVRLATNNPAYGPNNYSVSTYAGVPLTSGSADGLASVATFNAPNTLVVNNAQTLFLTDSGTGVGNPLRSIQYGAAIYTPVPTPAIGIVVNTNDAFGNAMVLFIPENSQTNLIPPYTYNSDPVMAIADDPGVTIQVTYGPTTNQAGITNYFTVPAYNSANSSPANMPVSILAGLTRRYPDMTFQAVGVASGSSRPESAVTSAEFVFQTAPLYNISPDQLDPFHIQLSEGTPGSTIYYTYDGTDPRTNGLVWDTNNAYIKIPSQYFNSKGEVLFQAVAETPGYYSSFFTNSFNISNAVYDVTLSPNSGYYPMGQTIQVTCPGTNVFYTTDGSEPTTNSDRVSNIAGNIGSIHWFNTTNDLSFLRVKAFIDTTNATLTAAGQPVSAATIGTPPDFNPSLQAGIGATVVIPVVCNLAPGQQIESFQFRLEIAPVNNPNTPVFSPLSIYPTNDFVPVITIAQNGSVASYSAAPYANGITNGLAVSAIGDGNNVLFKNYAVVSLLAVQIPYTANEGDTYSLNVLYPSATADGFNTPVPLTALPPVTIVVTNLPYLVGDSASATSGSWYNAGTFGDGNLDNADVNQAFDAASGLRTPYAFSDAFNAMDAYPVDTAGSVGGDGQIRFLDWNTILNRSLRLDTNNWDREWSQDGFLIDFTTNLVSHGLTEPATKAATKGLSEVNPAAPWYRPALLGADSVSDVAANSTVLVPVYAQLADGSSLSGLQFRVVVTPQASAPALSEAPQLVLASGVTPPYITHSFQAGETAFGWSVGSCDFASLSSNFLGWVSFTVPTNAVTGQTYQVSFLNADGAPDLNNQYTNLETRSATVAVNASAPPASICSDEWKINFFGSTTNPAAADNADPDGDGVPNWMEFLAGTDPTNPNSKLVLNAAALQTIKGQRNISVQWLTAPGRAYAVQWNNNLAGGAWQTLGTVSGNGYTTNCADLTPTNSTRYYRLSVLP